MTGRDRAADIHHWLATPYDPVSFDSRGAIGILVHGGIRVVLFGSTLWEPFEVVHMILQSDTDLDQQNDRGSVPRLRIVFADDNLGFIEHAVELLAKRCDIKCDIVGIATNGLSAVELVERLNPDVVVLDITMPQLDGLESARRLNADGCKAGIIFLTVHDDADFLREALAVGALAYVVKSRVMSDLPQALLHVAAGRRYVSPTPNLQASAAEDF